MAKTQWQDGPIAKKNNGGYEQECEWHTLNWNAKGEYIGQWQDDMLDGDGMIFIGNGPGAPDVAPLTEKQMKEAV